MTLSLLLLPSPLLGPSVWAPVAELLTARGHGVQVAAMPATVETPTDVHRAFLAAADGLSAPVLVPHSNAGLVAPAVAASVPGCPGIVFVDAVLPAPDGPTPCAPLGLLAGLEELVDSEGLLPPWTEWWPASEVDALFPDEETRRTVEHQQGRLPLAYFRSQVVAPPRWAQRCHAYLAFGATYGEELARARSLGWATRVLEGRHLHQLCDPRAVADAVEELAGSLVSAVSG